MATDARPLSLDVDAPIVRALVIAAASVALVGLVTVATAHPVVVLGGLFVAALSLALVALPIPALVVLLALQPFHDAAYSAVVYRAGLHVGPVSLWKDAVIVGLLARAVLWHVGDVAGLRRRTAGLERYLIVYTLAYLVIAAASTNHRAAASALARDVEGPLLLVAIVLSRPSRRALWACATAVVGSASVIGFVALFERLGPKDGLLTWYGAAKPVASSAFYAGHTYRAGSFLDSPLTLAFYLAAATPFAIGLTRAVAPRWRPLALIAVAGCVSGLVVTLTRSGYIGCGLGAATALALAIRNPRIRLALVGIVVVGVTCLVWVFLSSGSDVLVRSGSNAAHGSALQRDVELVGRRPLGYGLGTTDYVGQRFNVSGPGTTESTYMAKALEAGIAGLLLYLGALFAVVMRLRRVRLDALRRRDGPAAGIAAGAIGAVVGFAGAGLFLGVQELTVEVVVWGAAGIALAFAAAHARTRSTLA